MGKNIIYKCKLSSELADEEKEDFVEVFNKVFNLKYDMDWFDWKYIDNIYGDSLMVLAYDGNKLIGIRSFWRNDIDESLCYQPCDTAVFKEYRGRGIFSKMSLVALERVGDAFIYNFPNENSLPGNLKLGWKINKYCYLKPVFTKKSLRKGSKYIDDDYLIWKFGNSPMNKYHYCEKDGQNYLLFSRGKNIYYVLGRFNREHNPYFTKVNSPILFSYTTKETIVYKMFKNRTTIVSFEKGDKVINIDIPIFKADFF